MAAINSFPPLPPSLNSPCNCSDHGRSDALGLLSPVFKRTGRFYFFLLGMVLCGVPLPSQKRQWRGTDVPCSPRTSSTHSQPCGQAIFFSPVGHPDECSPRHISKSRGTAQLSLISPESWDKVMWLVLRAIELWGGLLHGNRQLKQYLALPRFGSFHCKMGSIMVCSYFIRLFWGSNEMKSMVSAQWCDGYAMLC